MRNMAETATPRMTTITMTVQMVTASYFEEIKTVSEIVEFIESHGAKVLTTTEPERELAPRPQPVRTRRTGEQGREVSKRITDGVTKAKKGTRWTKDELVTLGGGGNWRSSHTVVRKLIGEGLLSADGEEAFVRA